MKWNECAALTYLKNDNEMKKNERNGKHVQDRVARDNGNSCRLPTGFHLRYAAVFLLFWWPGVARRREASWASSSLRPRFLCDAQPATAHERAFSSDDWWLYVYISTSNRSQLILAANFAHPFYFNSSQSKLIPFVTTTWKDRKCPI